VHVGYATFAAARAAPPWDDALMKLFQFAYSPYAAKVRKCLELKSLACEYVEVPYLDRREVAELSGGIIMIPILTDGKTVVCDSPRITAYLDERYPASLRPEPLGAAATVFEAWADHVLEDVAFRLASPATEKRIAALNGGRDDARAMYRFVKERKFGAGCIDQWAANAGELEGRLVALTTPLARTLAEQPFLLGARPTLADAAVYGNLYMLEWAQPGFVAARLPGLAAWYARIEAARGSDGNANK
jgi:glutathione S-transferase